jgi:hypothetical protein
MGNGRNAGRPTVNRPPLRAPSEPSKPDHCFVYGIQSLHAVKVGISGNLYLRLSNIRVDNPHSPILLFHFEMPKRLALHLEARMKTDFHELRLVGDWFNITPEAALEAVERLKKDIEETAAQRAATLKFYMEQAERP